MSTFATADVLLMLEVRNGSAASFNTLVEIYRHDLIGYLYRMLENHAAAEELAQEAFLRAYRSRGTYQPTAKFTTWLYSIATRLALNWLRDNRLHRRYEPLEGTDAASRQRQFADPRPLAESALIHDDLVRKVRQAVGELPLPQRAAVVMHRYQNMTYEEIAAATGRSPQAIKSLLFRAHTALRDRLRPVVFPAA